MHEDDRGAIGRGGRGAAGSEHGRGEAEGDQMSASVHGSSGAIRKRPPAQVWQARRAIGKR
ncbi:hypothetical protein APY03_5124 [Variovorax sp. WDL1]|nr:hypothetical protein APY03_5124 [Variovorax sp. WDL1]